LNTGTGYIPFADVFDSLGGQTTVITSLSVSINGLNSAEQKAALESLVDDKITNKNLLNFHLIPIQIAIIAKSLFNETEGVFT
jgi:hypothetical protein